MSSCVCVESLGLFVCLFVWGKRVGMGMEAGGLKECTSKQEPLSPKEKDMNKHKHAINVGVFVSYMRFYKKIYIGYIG